MNNITVFSFNAYGGRMENFFHDLDAYISRRPSFVCLQECYEEYAPKHRTVPVCNYYGSMEQELRRRYWGEYEIMFAPRISTWDSKGKWYPDAQQAHWGNILMWNRSFSLHHYAMTFLVGNHDSFDYENDNTIPVNIQYGLFTPSNSSNRVLVANIHGWYAGKGIGKGDFQERIQQSQKIIDTLTPYHQQGIPIVIAGDFNLSLASQSLDMLCQKLDLNNVVQTCCIPCGRTSLYPSEKREQEPHATYVLYSKTINNVSCVADCECTASDHAPFWFEGECSGITTQ